MNLGKIVLPPPDPSECRLYSRPCLACPPSTIYKCILCYLCFLCTSATENKSTHYEIVRFGLWEMLLTEMLLHVQLLVEIVLGGITNFYF